MISKFFEHVFINEIESFITSEYYLKGLRIFKFGRNNARARHVNANETQFSVHFQEKQPVLEVVLLFEKKKNNQIQEFCFKVREHLIWIRNRNRAQMTLVDVSLTSQ